MLKFILLLFFLNIFVQFLIGFLLSKVSRSPLTCKIFSCEERRKLWCSRNCCQVWQKIFFKSLQLRESSEHKWLKVANQLYQVLLIIEYIHLHNILTRVIAIEGSTILDKIYWNSLNSSAIIYEFPLLPCYNVVSNKSFPCLLPTLFWGKRGEE